MTVCVATDYGREVQGNRNGIAVLTGRLDCDGMAGILKKTALCIDATHPYAEQATINIKSAAERANVPYKRLLRRKSPVSYEGITVKNAEEAADYLQGTDGNILLTTGVKELAAFLKLGEARLFPRVLPDASSLLICDRLGIPRRNIIAMQGPFSEEMNAATLRQFSIKYLVTKDGGVIGGFLQKAAAAQKTGAELLIISRPEESGEEYDEVLKCCKEMILKNESSF